MTLTSPPSTTSGPPKTASLTAGDLLASLRHAHEALLDALAELERITRGGVPNRRRFTNVRWTLSGASLTRRMHWAKILGFLLPRVGERAAEDIRRLQEDDIALLRTSTEHVATWTADNALAHWPLYCKASRAMRSKMVAGIEAEKRLLYPMLEAVSRGEAVA